MAIEETVLRYKYLPFSEGSLCVISDGTIKFSKPSEFNDPFDCAPDFDEKRYGEFVLNRPDLVKQAGDQLGLSPSQRIQNKTKMRKRVERAAREGDFGTNKRERIGVLSLSRSPLNLLMWAHYAENHTGFVTEFSIPIRAQMNEAEWTARMFEWLIPMKVLYAMDKPLLDPHDDKDTNMKKEFLTKSIDWEYENEERVIDYKRGPGIHPYNRNILLKSVIAGIRMSDEDFDELKNVIDHVNINSGTSIALHRASAAPRKFALNVSNRPDL